MTDKMPVWLATMNARKLMCAECCKPAHCKFIWLDKHENEIAPMYYCTVKCLVANEKRRIAWERKLRRDQQQSRKKKRDKDILWQKTTEAWDVVCPPEDSTDLLPAEYCHMLGIPDNSTDATAMAFIQRQIEKGWKRGEKQ